jgi:hypothetical protein
MTLTSSSVARPICPRAPMRGSESRRHVQHSGRLLVHRQQRPSGAADLGQHQLLPPDLALAAQAILAAQLELLVQALGNKIITTGRATRGARAKRARAPSGPARQAGPRAKSVPARAGRPRAANRRHALPPCPLKGLPCPQRCSCCPACTYLLLERAPRRCGGCCWRASSPAASAALCCCSADRRAAAQLATAVRLRCRGGGLASGEATRRAGRAG